MAGYKNQRFARFPNLDNPASLAGTLQNLLDGARPSALGQEQPHQAIPQSQQPDPVQQISGLCGKNKQQPEAAASKVNPSCATFSRLTIATAHLPTIAGR